MTCKYCPGTDLLQVYVSKAYRSGGTIYTPTKSPDPQYPDGDYWDLDEFHLEPELVGIIDAGDVDMKVCLDCFRIQGFELTPEEKQAIIKQHTDRGHNPRHSARQKKARQAAAKQERESRQHLYDKWRKDQPLRPSPKITP